MEDVLHCLLVLSVESFILNVENRVGCCSKQLLLVYIVIFGYDFRVESETRPNEDSKVPPGEGRGDTYAEWVTEPTMKSIGAEAERKK